MPGNAFLKFLSHDGKIVPGESIQSGHFGKDGWVEIGDWSWDIEAESSYLKGGGASVGKPTPGTFSFSHYYDKSSPTIMNKIVQGTHFKSAQLDLLKQTGKGTGELSIYFQIVAHDVFITKVSSKGGEDGAVSQDIEMVFKEIVVGYKQQNNKGELLKTLQFGWNISEMNLSPTAKLTI